MPTQQATVASVSTTIQMIAIGCVTSAMASAPGWSAGPTSGSVRIAQAMQYVPTCWSLLNLSILSTKPIMIRLKSSFETITTGTERLTGPNHEPMMYETLATSMKSRLSTIMPFWKQALYTTPILLRYSG